VAALVATVRVAEVPGCIDVGLKLHVGAFAEAGETTQVSATDPLNPFSAPTVTVEVAEAPGLTDAGFSAVAAMLKLACPNLATNASTRPPFAPCSAATTGKSVEVVLPVT
jgi:hypothetical protein